MEDEEEKKKWRTKILSKAKNASNNNNKASTEFIFKLMEYEKKYLKMIEYIDSHTPYHLILQYFEFMALADKTRLLTTIINKSEGYFGSLAGNGEKDLEVFPQLLSNLLRHYDQEYLKRALNHAINQKYYTPNSFVRYLLSSSPLQVSLS